MASPLYARGTSALELVKLALGHRVAPWVIVGLSMLLVSPAVFLGLTADDHFHTLALQDQPEIAGVARAPWDLFSFAKNPVTNGQLMEEGVFPWWTDPKLVLSFYRPLTSLTLSLDRALWPDKPAVMHLHSLAWFALLLAGAYLVYRRLLPSPLFAALALFFYAVDDARSMPVGWLSHRNALIGLGPGLFALWAHDRWRSERAPKFGLLAALCLVVGLHGGETALQTCGYLFAYAVCVDTGTRVQRVRSLLPYAAVVLVWRTVYDSLGYGAFGSGVYIDPGHDPIGFAGALLVRLPVLLLAEFALPFADLWEVYPLFAPWMRGVVLGIAAIVLSGLGWVLWPLLTRDRLARFWALGTLIATIPVCATHPEDRVLSATSIGGAALIALIVGNLVEKTYPRPSRLVLAAGIGLVGVHAVLAPMLLPRRTQEIDFLEAVIARADHSVPQTQQVTDETLVVLNPPIDMLATYFPLYRAARGIPRPRHFRWLATGFCDLHIARVDAKTLRLRPSAGFLPTASQRMFRSLEHPLAQGEKVQLSDATFEITEVAPDGQPLEALVRFQDDLESRKLRWMQWKEHTYVPFKPPALGQSVVVPAVDLAAFLLDSSGTSGS